MDFREIWEIGKLSTREDKARGLKDIGGSEDPLLHHKLLILDCISSVYCILFPSADI